MVLCVTEYLDFWCFLVGKSSICNAGDPGLIPGLGRSSGEGVGYPFQESNSGLLYHRQILHYLSHQGSSGILEWVAYPFSRGSSQPRNQTRLSCIAGGFFTRRATREAHERWSTATAKSLQSCPTLCDPIDGSSPGSPVPWIIQARTLEWGAISFSNAWKWKVKGKLLSRVRLFATLWTAAYQAPLSMGFSRQEYCSGVPLPSPTHTLPPLK